MDGDNVREVSADNEKASFEEVEHLIENGYCNIAMLSGKKMAMCQNEGKADTSVH